MEFIITPGSSNCPCKGCDKRYPGCHDKCEDYIPWKAALRKRRDQERKQKEGNRTMSEESIRRIWRKQRYQYQTTQRSRSDGDR